MGDLLNHYRMQAHYKQHGFILNQRQEEMTTSAVLKVNLDILDRLHQTGANSQLRLILMQEASCFMLLLDQQDLAMLN